MPLGGLLALFFLILLAASGGALWFYASGILAQVLSGAAYLYAASKAIGLVALTLILIAVLFVMLGRLIAAPMRRLSLAVREFGEKGTRGEVALPALAPRELRELVAEFAKMSASVELAEKRDREVSRVKSDFISTAAHQLRTPLTAVRWALEALAASNLTSEQRPLVEQAMGRSKDLVAIVGTLLDISAIESGKYKYQFAPLDLAALAREVVSDFTPLASERTVSLSLAPGEPIPPVRADRDRIKWVINNLVENAIRYTPPGGSVTLSLTQGSERFFLNVSDTGIGIAPGDRGNIFERFFRGEGARAKENEGNGLGLYIARQIARDHGGDITFAPNAGGVGTTFTLALQPA